MACLAVLCLTSACARPAALVAVPAPPTYDAERARLAEADALLRTGCLDCLVRAFQEYTALQAVPPTAGAAEEGRAKAAALIALREQELGMVDDGYWAQARPSTALDLVRSQTPSPLPRPQTPDTAAVISPSSATETMNSARAAAAQDELAAYLWLTLACSPLARPSVAGPDRLAAIGAFADTALVLYREASGCARNPTTLEALLNGDPRFKEIHYFLGNHALVPLLPQAAIEPDLDKADYHFRRAYEWRPAWPSVTLPIAHLAMAAEDFPRALDFYEKTLVLVPGDSGALLGRVKALTYLARHEEAIAGIEPLLAGTATVGDGRYWRAFNELQIDRNDEAWQDIELAAKVLRTVDIPKLAGIIAIKRQQLDVARRKLEEARDLHASLRLPPDCDIGFYLQTVLSDQRQWEPAAREALAAAVCFDLEAARITQDIARLQKAEVPEERRTRQIARREQQRSNSSRRRANALFNAAVAHFNLQRTDEARRLAELLVDDEIFGERARGIVARSQPLRP